MPSAKTSPLDSFLVVLGLIVLWIFAGCLILVAFGGCATVIPEPVPAQTAGFSGDTPHAGLSQTPAGLEIDASARIRYDALIELYGESKDAAGVPRFIPALKKDAGLTAAPDGGYTIDKEHLIDFGLMAGWARQGVAP